jgi:phage-related protein
VRWRKHYDQLAAFVNAHARYPNAMFATPDERTLRSWCSTQRNAHNGLGTATLTPEQEDLLENLPDWSW